MENVNVVKIGMFESYMGLGKCNQNASLVTGSLYNLRDMRRIPSGDIFGIICLAGSFIIRHISHAELRWPGSTSFTNWACSSRNSYPTVYLKDYSF